MYRGAYNNSRRMLLPAVALKTEPINRHESNDIILQFDNIIIYLYCFDVVNIDDRAAGGYIDNEIKGSVITRYSISAGSAAVAGNIDRSSIVIGDVYRHLSKLGKDINIIIINNAVRCYSES